MEPKINITPQELDRDINNLSLPETDLNSRSLESYDEEMKNWIAEDDSETDVED